jgi:hypothetical protein
VAGSISGMVTDGTDPVPGAEVRADSTIQGVSGGSTITNPDGTYVIDGLATSSYRVQVLAEGFGTEWYDGQPSHNTADLVEVNVPTATTGIDFVLAGGAGGISGVVKDEFDNPIPFAHIQVWLFRKLGG